MPCNLNFNQCSSGRQYPSPAFNCFRNFIADLNKSDNTIINPVVDTSFALSTINSQLVATQGAVSSTLSFLGGDSISFSNDVVTLKEGTYLVSYAASGFIPTGGIFAFALYRNETQIGTSITSTSGNVGDSASGSDSEIISVVGTPVQITLRNIGSGTTTLTSGNITVQRV